MNLIVKQFFSALLCLVFLFSCSYVEMSGTMTKKTGEVMEDYSKQNDGIIGDMAGFGGRIHKAVGATVEDVARQGRSEATEKTEAEQFVEANEKVINVAFDAAANKAVDETKVIIAAQKSLKELGYYHGEAHGILDNKTKTGILKYQKAKSLKATGVLDNETLNSLGVKTTY